MDTLTKERMKQINNEALAVYRFALQKHIEFETITDYMRRLGHAVDMYTKSHAPELNEKYGTKKDKLDFATVAAMTCKPYGQDKCHVFFNLEYTRYLMVTNALHELGHILLNHLDDICESNRDYYEKEADYFTYSFELLDKKYKQKVSRHNKKREKAVLCNE